MSGIEEQVAKLKEHVPEDKTDDDIRALIEETGGDEAAIQGKIAEWWEQSAAGTEEEEAPPKPKPAPKERAPPPEKKKPSGGSKSKSSGSSDKEMMDFRHLMVKGLELKKSNGSVSEKCVIYMDVTCRTLFCASQKNSPNAKAHRVEDITEATASSSNEKIISIGHKDGALDLEVSSPKVRDYLVRMLNKLFTGEKNKASEKEEGRSSKPKSSSRSDKGAVRGKPTKPSGGGGSSRSADSGSSRSGRNQVSQVRLLAEHCYTLSDDAIEEMVAAKIPTHSRWESYQEFKEKIDRRDELIKSLQEGLGTLNGERFRFQRACEDIELHHQDELKELKQHLSMALTSFQELQRASESREGEMREALKGANSRSEMFEQEKAALMESMNNERVNGAVAAKEAEMLKESVTKLEADVEKKTAEYEDARKRFSQVKEALTVERNLRARAEIKEEQIRQEIIQTTGQMHAMKDTFVEDHSAQNKEIEEKTAALEAKTAELEKSKEERAKELADAEMELKTATGELDGLKEALSSKNAQEASKLKALQDKVATLPGLKKRLAELEQEKFEAQGASKEEADKLKGITEEQKRELDLADEDRMRMHAIIAELRGAVRVYVRVRPGLPSDPGVGEEGTFESAVKMGDDNQTTTLTSSSGAEHSFKVDKTFASHATQEDVFAGLEEVVNSSLDGYHVCLLSWGETGSGKSHTVVGSGNQDQRGLIARSMELVAKGNKQQRAKGWTYTFELNVIEFYNEQVIDLLRDEGTDKEDLAITPNKRGVMQITNSKKVVIEDPGDSKAIDTLVETALVNRKMTAPEDEQHASRSTLVYTLYLTGVHDDGACVSGILNLCDLAGSEVVKGELGEHAKAADTYSKSVANLADVFNGLATNATYIPFRGAKLTYYLQPALCGDGKIMLVVTLNPTKEAFEQSLASLRFGESVKRIELGKAIRNVVEAPTDVKKKSATGGGGSKKGAADDAADSKGDGAKKGGKKKK